MNAQTATVLCLVGNRCQCELLASAGLGLAGVGTYTRLHIDYKPGEVVTEERVLAALRQMQEAMDREQTVDKLLSFKVESITQRQHEEGEV